MMEWNATTASKVPDPGEVTLGHAIVAPLDQLPVGVVQRAVTPPSTIMHAPMQEADSSEAR
jgi:hypothetical protein